MKKFVALLCILSFVYTAQSQIYVGDVNINKKNGINFVELVGTTNNYKMEVVVDYGQANPEVEEIRDKDGTIARSGNVISALNLMTSNGWEFVTSYGYGSNDQSVVRYLLRKETK